MKKFFVIIGIAAFLTLFLVIILNRDRQIEPLVYEDNLNRLIVTADDHMFILHDLSFYVGFQEGKVQEQAKIYDPEHPWNYWNVHTNGEFIKITARDNAIDMMIHDWYYSKQAAENGLTLTEEELALSEDAAADYWSDLSDRGKEVLGLTREDVSSICRDIALAEKYMIQLSNESGRDIAVFRTGGKAWEDLKDSLPIFYEKETIRRIEFGRITVN